MRKSSIANRLITSYLLLGVFTIALISVIFYFSFEHVLIERTTEQLASINMLKKKRLEDYVENRNDIKILLHNPVFLEVITYSKFLSQQKEEELHQHIKQLMDEQHYTNLIVLDIKDSVLYSSAHKESELCQMFGNKGKREQHLAEFIKQSKLGISAIDITSILPSSKITLLLGLPIHDSKGVERGIVVLEKNMRVLDELLQERTGMGHTGETYLVGADFKMRSRSHFFPQQYPTKITVNTRAVQQGLKGINGKEEIKDYRGEPVLSVFSKIDIKGLNWVIVSEIDFEEAMHPIDRIRNYIMLITFFIAVLIVVITYVISQKMSHPILALHKVVLNLSKGVLPEKKIEVAIYDEIGQITEALNDLVEALRTTSYFASEIGKGNLMATFNPLSENDELGNALIQMRDNLKKLNEERYHLMQQRSMALIEGQEKERTRIARELHDGIGQMLTAIRLKLNFIENAGPEKRSLKKMLDDTTQEVKRISKNLMPTLLVDFGLKAALDELIKNIQSYSTLAIDYQFIESNDAKINFEIEVSVYRIVQEAINNCLKYADATLLKIQVHIKNNEITLLINDNGKGFDMQQLNDKNFNGIKNMRERVYLLNGEFELKTIPGAGTTIAISIPTPTTNGKN